MKPAALLLLCTMLLGCQPIEKQAYEVAVGSKAFLDSLHAAHAECLSTSSTLCSDLERATSAQHVLIAAGEIYCDVGKFDVTDTTPCRPPVKGTPAYQSALERLQSALNVYQLAAKDLKAVIK